MKKFLLFFLLSANIFAQKIDTLHIFSDSMQKTIKNVVIIPDNHPDENTEFPVLYLLHGAYGSFTDWITKVLKIIF